MADVVETVTWYRVPGVRPPTTQEVEAVTQELPPGDAVTRYERTGLPNDGGFQNTEIWFAVVLARTFNGTDGGPGLNGTWTVIENETVTLAPEASLTLTPTVELPDVVGVPEIRPLDAPIESPFGSPVAA